MLQDGVNTIQLSLSMEALELLFMGETVGVEIEDVRLRIIVSLTDRALGDLRDTIEKAMLVSLPANPTAH